MKTRPFWVLLFVLAVLAPPVFAQITPADSIYFVMTDRFHDGDPDNNYSVRPNDWAAYHGGDFAGLIEKLDYIEGLGFSAIWISPVVDNQRGGYHGYWTVDFYAVEEHFGDMETLRQLVREAHARDMKVIVDLVVNHTAVLHPWNADPEYDDWFNPRRPLVEAETQEEIETFWLASLPDLNHENPEVNEYLIDMSLWWIEQTGIDGYRLDTVKHVPAHFWEAFADAIHAEYPDFYLVGEVFDGRLNYVGNYQNTGMNGLLDFPIYFPLQRMLVQDGTGTELARMMEQAAQYPDRSQMGTFIDNHDVERFINNERNFREGKLRQGLLFLFTYTGIPIMYYGTEIPLEGGSDHGNRADMVWDEEGKYVEDVRQLTAFRREYPALVEGEIEVLGGEEHWAAFARSSDDSVLVTVLNTNTEEADIDVPIPQRWRDYRSGRDLLTDSRFTLRRGQLRLELPAYTGALIELSEERYGFFRRLFGN